MLGQLDALDRRRRDQRGGRDRGRRCRADWNTRRGGDCGGQRRLGIDEFLLRRGEIVLRGLDGVDRGGDLGARLDQVRTEGLHIADGCTAIGEHPPVTIEGLDVALGRAAEVLVSGRERGLRGAHPGLGVADAGLRGGYRILGRRRSPPPRPIVVAAGHGQERDAHDHGDQTDQPRPCNALTGPRKAPNES